MDLILAKVLTLLTGFTDLDLLVFLPISMFIATSFLREQIVYNNDQNIPIFPLVDDSEFRVSVSCSNPVDARVKNNRQGAPHGMSGWRLNNLDLFVLFCERNLFRERVCTLQAVRKAPARLGDKLASMGFDLYLD